MNVQKIHIKDGAHKESKSTGGTKNYQKQKEGNDKKQCQRLEFVTTGEKKDLVCLNLEAVRESISLHIYLWVLLCCNFKIEQRKHLSLAQLLCLHCDTDPPLEQNHYLTYLTQFGKNLWSLCVPTSHCSQVPVEQVAQIQVQPRSEYLCDRGFCSLFPYLTTFKVDFFFLVSP